MKRCRFLDEDSKTYEKVSLLLNYSCFLLMLTASKPASFQIYSAKTASANYNIYDSRWSIRGAIDVES